MNIKTILSVIFVVSVLLGNCISTEGRKISDRQSAKGKVVDEKEEMTAGSFMVASECENCNNGYRLNQVVFSGFDKKLRSNQESFFITNHTDRTLTAVALYIDYLTPDGRQLHKKYYRLVCNIPPGETRKADIRTWDTQNSFYYEKCAPSRGGGSPFTVRFDPVAYYLRY
ncbi:MAG: hypothetical protein K2J70_00935 [Muribaculaceae bacterium]|nr:hypothetical protein [Muribaculaceae bacterium]